MCLYNMIHIGYMMKRRGKQRSICDLDHRGTNIYRRPVRKPWKPMRESILYEYILLDDSWQYSIKIYDETVGVYKI